MGQRDIENCINDVASASDEHFALIWLSSAA